MSLRVEMIVKEKKKKLEDSLWVENKKPNCYRYKKTYALKSDKLHSINPQFAAENHR